MVCVVRREISDESSHMRLKSFDPAAVCRREIQELNDPKARLFE